VKALTILVALTLAATAPAQSTWKNLHFGQSRDDVRTALTAQDIAVETSQEGSLESTSDYQLFVPGLRHTLPLHAQFRFTDAGGLMDITLNLDLPAMRQTYTEFRTDETLLTFASDRLTRALTNIYAAPVSTTSECDADPSTFANKPTGCTIDWHGTAQSIAIEWFTHPAHLYIRYQMLSPDL
jgi:hypothetical protein